MNFYLLWVILKGIPVDYIRESKTAVLYRITKIFSALRSYDSAEKIEKVIKETWSSVQSGPNATQNSQSLLV